MSDTMPARPRHDTPLDPRSAEAIEWPAKWVTTQPDPQVDKPAMPLFRRAIELDAPVSRAMAYICGLGHFELRVNGRKAGDDVLEPGWTDYRKRCLYVCHDLTALLRRGRNVLGVMLGNGMYNVTGGRYSKFKASFGRPMWIARIEIELAGGGRVTLTSDELWRWTPGPITFSCIYGGEDFDARLEPRSWDGGDTAPGYAFDDTTWMPVELSDGPGGGLYRSVAPAVRVMGVSRSVSAWPCAGAVVHDLGQNFAGRPMVSVRGEAGSSVTLTTGELVDEGGAVNQKFTGRPVNFTYTLRGQGVETWQPRFSLTGFRYVSVTTRAATEGGAPPEVVAVSGERVCSSAERVGEFACSSELFNQIHRLIDNAVLSNLQSVMTDCPHREKLGWLEQTHLMGPGILLHYAAAGLYAKVSDDIEDAQHESGCVPTIAPQYVSFKPPWDVFNDSPEWGSACVLNPWLVYRYTGDAGLIERHYPSMCRWVDYLASRSIGAITAYGLGDWYDIGPGEPGFAKLTSLAVTGTAIYFECLTVMARSARLLGRDDDADAFEQRAGDVRRAFNATLFDAAHGWYDRGSQTAQAMPLALGIVEPGNVPRVLGRLVDDIRANDNHITAGDIGFKYVLAALSQAGRDDVIVDLLSRRDPPSYGAQIEAGATALAEAWDANPRKSQNHMMLGHALGWFIEGLVGLRVDHARQGPARLTIRPADLGADATVSWARARHRSSWGWVEAAWRREGGKMTLDVSLPAGGHALVAMPGRIISKTGAAVAASAEAGRDTVELGPGAHRVVSVPG